MDELIPEIESEPESRCTSFIKSYLIQIFMTLKLLILLCYFISNLFKFPASFKLVLLAIICLADFWYTKNVAGLELVGMRWSHEINEDGEPEWHFYSRPDPYVPNPSDSGIFWGFMFGSVLVWMIIAVWSLFAFGKLNVFICLLILFLNSFHLIFFLNCRSEEIKHENDLTRNLMLKAFEDDEEKKK